MLVTPPRPFVPRARTALSAVWILTLLLGALPDRAAAQLGGLRGAIRKKIEEKITPPAAGGSGRALPPGFVDPRYEINAARLDGLLRGAVKAEDAEAAYARYEAGAERRQAAAERQGEEAARLQEEVFRKSMAASSSAGGGCQMQVMQRYAELPESDARRKRAEGLVERFEAMGAELERRERSGQPVDTVAYGRRTLATMDSLALLMIGRKCPPPPPGAMQQSQRQAEELRALMERASRAPVAPTDTVVLRPDVGAIVRQTAGLDERQMGVVCDKLIAYVGATKRNEQIAGFTDAERSALAARLEEVRKHGKTICSSGFEP